MTTTHESWEKKAIELLQKEKAREKTMTLPTHESIATEIHKFVAAHVDFHAAHNRENLDDLIADLIQYMQTLPTVGQYIDANEL